MTCKDCNGYDVCAKKGRHFAQKYGKGHHAETYVEDVELKCIHFKDKSEWVHLPCKKGDVLIRNGIRCKVDHWNVIATAFTEDEKCRLFGLEEADRALEDMRKEDEGK